MEEKELVPGLKIITETETEKYRAETFTTKEPETIEWINRFSGGVFVDIGANIGVYSLYAAFLHKDITVYAFEPVYENYIRLLENIKLNGLANIVAFNCAVSNRSGLTTLFIPDMEVGASGSQIDKATDEHGVDFAPEKEQIAMQITLDDLLKFTAINYIKIDVDGRENLIIGAAKRSLGLADSVLIECNKDKLSTSSLNQFMKNYASKKHDKSFDKIEGHSSERRGGNPVNIVYASI